MIVSFGWGFRSAALAALTAAAVAGAPASGGFVDPQPARRTTPFPPRGDEFLGPFPSWTNVKTTYRAAGDGIADDTDAIQQGLDELGTPGHSPVLFLPAGVYRITRPLSRAYTINISVIGEDPATTRLVWDGPPGGTMMQINGVAYSRFARLTFDGKRRASIAVDQSYDNSKPHFDTGNEYGDDVFVDVEYGIHGGFKGHGFAETSIVRAHFVRNTRAGVALGNFNALDTWIWYSTFDDCAVGVTNSSGAGNFRVYGSVFRNSATADLAMGNTGGFSARDNYSIGARTFFTGGYTNNPATIDLQRNVVVDPIEPAAVRMANQGPALILDNVIRSREGAGGPAIVWANFFGADVTSVGNTFTVASPVRSSGRLTAVDDRVVSRASLNPVEPTLPGTPEKLGRTVYEVRPGSDAAAIQRVIDAAADRVGERPVVHIPYGTYSVARTLTVPVGDVQVTGDGYATILKWTGAGRGPVIRLTGPSKATLNEIQLDGTGQADVLMVDNADQPGARVYLQEVQLRAARQADLLIDALDETYVQLEDVGNAYSREATSIKITGGPVSASGGATSGRTNVFSGASSGNRTSYDVSGGARVLVRDLWYESSAGSGFANVHGRAVFTAQNVRIASPNGVPAFNISDLNGTAAVLTAHIDDRIWIAGDGRNARFLGVGIFCERQFPTCFVNETSPRARALVVNSRQRAAIVGTRSVAAVNIGDAGESAFIRAMLQHARGEQPTVPTALPAGVTDVRLFRVWVANGLNNVTLTGRPPR